MEALDAAFPTIGEAMPSNVTTFDDNGKKKKKKKKDAYGFAAFGLCKNVFGAIRRIGYKQPTPIQRAALPPALSGADIVAMARTGSGKTAAFIIPIIERLQVHNKRMGCRAVLISPTRELATQTLKFARDLSKFTNLRLCLLVGGESIDRQLDVLSANPDIIIATPGRITHLLEEVKSFSLNAVQVLVFDEADRLFEMGFRDQLNDILKATPDSRQTMLFSATMPKMLVEFTRAGLQDPSFIRLDTESQVSPNLRMNFVTVRPSEKPAALLHICAEIIGPAQQTIIFVSTKYHVEFITELLKSAGHLCACVYGALDPMCRKANIAKFRAARAQFLIVTDVAARGIDIPMLDNVINYDFPAKPKLFVHRVGRAARQHRNGSAISMVTPEDLPYMLDLMLFLGKKPDNGDGRGPKFTLIADGGDTTAIEKNDSMKKKTICKPEKYSLSTQQPDELHYGGLPRFLLDSSVEAYESYKNSSVAIQETERVALNGYKAYIRTRPPASKTSQHRCKELHPILVHPLFREAAELSGSNATAEIFASKLSNYRPSMTVMEVQNLKSGKGVLDVLRAKRIAHQRHIYTVRTTEKKKHSEWLSAGGYENDTNDKQMIKTETVSGGKRKQNQCDDISGSDTIEIYKKHKTNKIAKCQAKIPKRKLSKAERKRMKKQRLNPAISNAVNININTDNNTNNTTNNNTKTPLSFRDNSVFINVRQSDSEVASSRGLSIRDNVNGDTAIAARQHMQEAVLDLMPDEVSKLGEQRRFFWDKKKRKYVKTSLNDIKANKNRVKTESGKMAKKEVGKIYEQWCKKNKRSILSIGEEEGGGTAASTIAFEAQGMDLKTMRRKGLSRGAIREKEKKSKAATSGGELYSAETIRKQRKEKEKRRAKNGRGRGGRGRSRGRGSGGRGGKKIPGFGQGRGSKFGKAGSKKRRR